MLSERERKTLNEIEQAIYADDPSMARCFADGFAQSARLWPYTLAITLGAVLLVVSIVLQLLVSALIAIVVTIVAVGGRYLARRRSRDEGGLPDS